MQITEQFHLLFYRQNEGTNRHGIYPHVIRQLTESTFLLIWVHPNSTLAKTPVHIDLYTVPPCFCRGTALHLPTIGLINNDQRNHRNTSLLWMWERIPRRGNRLLQMSSNQKRCQARWAQHTYPSKQKTLFISQEQVRIARSQKDNPRLNAHKNHFIPKAIFVEAQG